MTRPVSRLRTSQVRFTLISSGLARITPGGKESWSGFPGHCGEGLDWVSGVPLVEEPRNTRNTRNREGSGAFRSPCSPCFPWLLSLSLPRAGGREETANRGEPRELAAGGVRRRAGRQAAQGPRRWSDTALPLGTRRCQTGTERKVGRSASAGPAKGKRPRCWRPGLWLKNESRGCADFFII